MKSSLDRKIERAAREAQEERKRHSSPLSAEAFSKNDHLPDGTVQPSAPTQAQQATSGDGCLKPKPQRLWVRDGLDWVDDNEDKCAFYFTCDGEQPAEDMANVESIRTVKTITTAQAMIAVRDAVQNEIDVARSWHGELVACMFEHLGGQDNPVVVENVYAIAQLFMGRVFGISHDSELNKRPDVPPDDDIAPISSNTDSLNALMTARPAPTMVSLEDFAQSMVDLLMTGMSVTQNGKRIDPRAVRLPLDEMPSGNFGQRQPTTGMGIQAELSSQRMADKIRRANPNGCFASLERQNPIFKDENARPNITSPLDRVND